MVAKERIQEADNSAEERNMSQSGNLKTLDLASLEKARQNYREKMLIQVGKAMAEGYAERLAEGWAKGVAKGLPEGLAKGLAKGLAEGRAEGRAEGKREAALYVARLLLRKKFPAEMAEKVTGLSHAEIQALAEEISREDAASFKDLAKSK
ncbi:MAG: hypothetical protein LBO66_08525 [Deltaproteobacteria bacterium]|nr:hypothetical protein [Deltaproteobacteria bacterium]